MNIELKKQRNDLLKRTNVLAKITAITTPSRKEVSSKIAAMLGVDENLIVIDNIEQNFGDHSSLAYVKVYDDLKILNELESKYKMKRTGLEVKEEVKEAKEEAKEEPKEEAKDAKEAKEEVKEELKEEAKEEPEEEVKETPKEDAKEEPKAEAKEEKKE
jgi:ribosomal protein S24E